MASGFNTLQTHIFQAERQGGCRSNRCCLIGKPRTTAARR
jgi:hypothetical protein